jgi:Pectinacetylesterase
MNNRFKASLASGSRLFLASVAALLAAPVLATSTPPSGWQKIDNPGPVIGADRRQHTATCSGYPGTDAKFSFWTKRTASKNVMVYFEGGGACWDSLTCTFPIAGLPAEIPQFFVPAVDPATDPSTFDGVFKADNPANPVADWNVVYIPYCTGDLHTGSTSKTYLNVGHPTLPLPTSFRIQHRGFDNFMVVLDWMKKNIDKPAKVLVAGSSAGGYGATANFPWIQRTYPRASTYVLADASQGVTTAAWDTGKPGRGSWNIQLAPWVYGADPSLIPGPELMRVASKASPRTRTAQFTTVQDGVQIGFYSVLKLLYGPGGSCADPAVDWYQQMSTKLVSYATDVPNFRHYVASGDYHTILRSPQFFAESSAGSSFNGWLSGMLKTAGGSPWDSIACPDCLAPVGCP